MTDHWITWPNGVRARVPDFADWVGFCVFRTAGAPFFEPNAGLRRRLSVTRLALDPKAPARGAD